MSYSATTPALGRVILYVKDIGKAGAFYQTHFGLRVASEERGWLDLASPSGGCRIALHQASKGQKSGSAVKLVFAVRDVEAFKKRAAGLGLKFGPVHVIPGSHEYANAKDPAGNSISISTRPV